MADRIYLDHAATTSPTPAARAATAEAMVRWANPSSPHAEGRAARAALEAARGEIAAAYAWDGELLFTSGASEALALALGRFTGGARVVTAVEHDAALRAAGRAAVVPVGADGVLDLDALRSVLAHRQPFVPSPSAGRQAGRSGQASAPRAEVETPRAASVAHSSTSLETNGGDGRPIVCVQWCNSETGVCQPIAEIAAIVHDAGGVLLVDAAQMPASPDLAAHADLIAVSAHKRGGPPGIGALLVRDLALLHPTGGQERGYRPGTENLPGALGWAAALAEPEPDYAGLRARLDDAIVRSGGVVVAAGAARHPAIGSYRMPGVAAAAQLIRFDLAGFAVSAGSACASGSLKPSHVLRAMGWDETATREVVRVSFGRTTTAAEVDAFAAEWRRVGRAARMIAA